MPGALEGRPWSGAGGAEIWNLPAFDWLEERGRAVAAGKTFKDELCWGLESAQPGHFCRRRLPLPRQQLTSAI